MVTREPNAAVVYVEDACGERFCYSAVRIDLVQTAKKHAQRFILYRTRSNAYLDKDALGNRLRSLVKPCRVVVEPYFDDSAA